MECNHLEHRTNTKKKTKRQTCLARLEVRELASPAPTYYLIKKFKIFRGGPGPYLPPLEHRTNTKTKTKRQTCLARLQARELTSPAHTT